MWPHCLLELCDSSHNQYLSFSREAGLTFEWPCSGSLFAEVLQCRLPLAALVCVQRQRAPFAALIAAFLRNKNKNSDPIWLSEKSLHCIIKSTRIWGLSPCELKPGAFWRPQLQMSTGGWLLQVTWSITRMYTGNQRRHNSIWRLQNLWPRVSCCWMFICVFVRVWSFVWFLFVSVLAPDTEHRGLCGRFNY